MQWKCQLRVLRASDPKVKPCPLECHPKIKTIANLVSQLSNIPSSWKDAREKFIKRPQMSAIKR